MIVEGYVVAHDNDMVAGEAACWLDPHRRKSGVGISLQKCVSEDVARAASEENPVRQRPPANLVPHDPWGKNVHSGASERYARIRQLYHSALAPTTSGPGRRPRCRG